MIAARADTTCSTDAGCRGGLRDRSRCSVFKALADPTRVAIVSRLACCDECCVCDLTATFDLSQPTVSHHLKILREAGLVESEGRGTWAYYRIVPEALSRLGEVFSTPNAIER